MQSKQLIPAEYASIREYVADAIEFCEAANRSRYYAGQKRGTPWDVAADKIRSLSSSASPLAVIGDRGIPDNGKIAEKIRSATDLYRSTPRPSSASNPPVASSSTGRKRTQPETWQQEERAESSGSVAVGDQATKVIKKARSDASHAKIAAKLDRDAASKEADFKQAKKALEAAQARFEAAQAEYDAAREKAEEYRQADKVLEDSATEPSSDIDESATEPSSDVDRTP